MNEIDPFEWESQNRTEKGGFSKEALAKVGVSWPPKKGWMKGWKARWLEEEVKEDCP